MTRDPFEELFGPREDDTTPIAEPVPARQRLAQEQAERVRTAQLPAGKRDGRPPRERRAGAAPAAPWIVVGIVAVLAIVASIVVVNLVRAGGADEAATPAPTATQAPPTTTAPAPAPEPSEDPEEEDPADGPPQVEVGQTMTMAITQWGVTSDLSTRFGSTSYNITGENLVLTSDLLESFPDSCAEMRQQWGATRTAAGGYTVLKPATRCAETPEVYDEIWGLVDAWVQTIR
ncbi:hypothetical protein MUN78_10920 [Leucobacter allii]|uniref:Serine/threonine protein kinase n=1 Tax=Leucobacter allii TaxID=2932247 RepID=A0ABY4FJM0_9MICO|nr:hypothetical protein [Leucobacter allii]UOQ56202.1 hypothetical protein MUN78_10920 [Leucobacter allii]UOR00670.1 hypothetical protein MUN77_10925 [Leucobacter allii]